MKLFRLTKKLIYRSLSRQVVLHCVGDSHVQNFEYLEKQSRLPTVDIRICQVPGATNMGLANPHSQTQAMPIFLDYRNNVAPEDWVLFCLGEVDCGFVIWYRAEKQGTAVEEQFEQSLNNYFQLIQSYLIRVSRATTIVSSVPLPTIADNQLIKGEVANKRLSITATQKQRTLLTIEYNRKLREYCKENGVHFLDLENETLDRKTGVASSLFLNKNPLDHHFEPEKMASLIVPKLARLGIGRKTTTSPL